MEGGEGGGGNEGRRWRRRRKEVARRMRRSCCAGWGPEPRGPRGADETACWEWCVTLTYLLHNLGHSLRYIFTRQRNNVHQPWPLAT